MNLQRRAIPFFVVSMAGAAAGVAGLVMSLTHDPRIGGVSNIAIAWVILVVAFVNMYVDKWRSWRRRRRT